MITLYTIGFTKKSAEKFFLLLQNANIKKLIDIRINNSSQLAGFTKGKDLEYFTKQLCGAEYFHLTDLAPSKDLLKLYSNKEINWEEYTRAFKQLLLDRKIAIKYKITDFDKSCFLCTEESPEQCHRRLVVEFLAKNTHQPIKIIHLK